MTVTSEYKAKLYTQWVEHFMTSFAHRANLQGHIYGPIIKLENKHKKIAEVLKKGLEEAEKTRKEYIRKDPLYLRVKHILCSTTLIGMLGGVIALFLNPAAISLWIGAGLGGLGGARVGYTVAMEDLETQSYISSLPIIQKVFIEEIDWIESIIPIVEKEIEFDEQYLERCKSNHKDVGIEKEKNQLVALRAHFKYVIDQHHAISKLPILDPKPRVKTGEDSSFFDSNFDLRVDPALMTQFEKEREATREMLRHKTYWEGVIQRASHARARHENNMLYYSRRR